MLKHIFKTGKSGLTRLLIVLSIILTTGCAAQTPEPLTGTPVDEPTAEQPARVPEFQTPAPAITEEECDAYLEGGAPLVYPVDGADDDPYPPYVKNHVVVTEPSTTAIANGRIDANPIFKLVDSVQVFEGYSTSLYEFDSTDFSVWEMVLYILTQYAQDGERYAEPNYVLGLPYDIEGSPYDIEGSTDGATLAEHGDDIEDQFWNQWAFSNLNLSESVSDIQQEMESGVGVTVAVFDSSPFPVDGYKQYAFSKNIFGFCVRSLYTEESNSEGQRALKDHGLAVAGLVHALAPASRIHLVQVLNNDLKGDFYRLLKGMAQFLDQHEALGEDSGAPGLVFNLSLGFRPENANPPDYIRVLFNIELFEELSETLDSEIPSTLGALIQKLEGQGLDVPELLQELVDPSDNERLTVFEAIRGQITGSPPEQECGLQDRPDEPVPVCALRFVINTAMERDATIVAAAGNESAEESTPLTAQLPALWDDVISVGATNKAGHRSCYSNKAEVYAPGADGGQDLQNNRSCIPNTSVCNNDPQGCLYGLISLMTGDPVLNEQNVVDVNERFGYWVGTSFATPLVSGTSARLLSNDTQPTQLRSTLKDTMPSPEP